MRSTFSVPTLYTSFTIYNLFRLQIYFKLLNSYTLIESLVFSLVTNVVT